MTEKTTRASVPKPPRKSAGFLPASGVVGAANNMREDDLVSMTFSMDRRWHTEFKMTATANGMSMKELLTESFEAWKASKEGR